MRIRNALLASTAATAAVLFQLGVAAPALAQSAAALTGKVGSAAEPVMEGVVVSAKKDGSTITVSVVTDDRGQYSFPAARLEPGHYTLSARAIGYDLDGPKAADVTAGQAALADIKLKPTRNLSSQLTNAEWMMSMPGSDEQKAFLLNCNSCHTIERIVRSTHDADEFVAVQKRMGTYANQSVPTRPQLRKAERLLEERGNTRNKAQQDRAEFLSSVNLSESSTWSYPLKTLPRPTSRSPSPTSRCGFCGVLPG